MSKQREALKLALEALEQYGTSSLNNEDAYSAAIKTLREALAEPEKTNQCGETCERAKLCAVCAGGVIKNEQEPVAWTTTGQIAAMDSGFLRYIEGRDPRFVLVRHDDVPLYISPPARKPLTDSEVFNLAADYYEGYGFKAAEFARAIERAHGIGEV